LHLKTFKLPFLRPQGAYYRFSVGKTSLMNRFHSQKFSGDYKATIGADFLSKTVVLDRASNKEATLQIWDTAGQERFQSLGVAFYRGADVCILVYDVTDPKSLDNLNGWRNEFLKQVTDSPSSQEAKSFPFVILGNKVDKDQRSVSSTRSQEWLKATFAQSQPGSWRHYETSAKSAQNVDEAFKVAAQLAYEREQESKRQSNGYSPSPNKAMDPYANEYYNPATDLSTPYGGVPAPQSNYGQTVDLNQQYYDAYGRPVQMPQLRQQPPCC